MYGFLIIYVIALLEFKQALKNFLDLKIYRVFIKQFDQIKRKTKKIQKREREIKRMGKNHKCRQRYIGCNSSVIFGYGEKKCMKKQFHFAINSKVSQNPAKNIHIYF